MSSIPERAPENHFDIMNLLTQGLVRAYELGAAEEAAKEEWQHKALHDDLTGLLHKRPFLEAADQRIARAKPGQVLALALVDLDNFKAINDLHPKGYDEGDRVLATIGSILLENTRQDEALADLVAHGKREDSDSARLGGDEFAIFAVLEARARNNHGMALSPAEKGQAFGDRLNKELKAPFQNRPDLDKLGFGVSMGIVLRRPGETAGQMLSRSDRELKAAKQVSHDQNGAYRTFQLN